VSDEARRQQELRTKAQQDISDIDALAASQPFNRFWVGYMNARYRSELRASLMGGTVDEREKARIRALLLEELTQAPATERLSAEKLLRTPPSGPPRPIQVG
jgi:hypothetical protein